jgi:hypothetical protein
MCVDDVWVCQDVCGCVDVDVDLWMCGCVGVWMCGCVSQQTFLRNGHSEMSIKSYSEERLELN